MLAQTVQTSAVGLNYHIVVPSVNGAVFYFLVHCLCLYFHVNILFSSSKYLRSHPGPACWKSAPQQANQMVSKSSDFLCCFVFALQHRLHNSKGLFFLPLHSTHISLVSWVDVNSCKMNLEYGNSRGWSTTENSSQWFGNRWPTTDSFQSDKQSLHLLSFIDSTVWFNLF